MQRIARSPAIGAFRQLSTKAAPVPPVAANHLPPKKIPGINGRYAGAVYTAASKVTKTFILIWSNRNNRELYDRVWTNLRPKREISQTTPKFQKLSDMPKNLNLTECFPLLNTDWSAR